MANPITDNEWEHSFKPILISKEIEQKISEMINQLIIEEKYQQTNNQRNQKEQFHSWTIKNQL